MLKYSTTENQNFIFKPSTLTQTLILKTVLSYTWVATVVVMFCSSGSTRGVKVSRPTWSREHFFGLGLGLGLTVIGLGLGLGII